MGYCAEPTEEMGEYSVEVRSESFVLSGQDGFQRIGDRPCEAGCDVDGQHTHGTWGYKRERHAITVYPHGDINQGSVEILIEDIPKVRAALDQVERIEAGEKR
jgi:hypothetical protein